MREGWEIRPLGSVSAINYGYTESASHDPVGPRFLRITDIQDDHVDWASVPYCTINAADVPKYRLATGDIVFARTGATTGKSFLVYDPPEAVFASYLIRLRLTSTKLLPEFLSRFLQTDTYWQAIKDGSTGSAQGGFNATKLAALAVPMPPLPEQKRIVAILDDAFKGIATAIANTERNRANARELFDSYLNSVFTHQGEGWIERRFGEICVNLDSRRVPITKSDRVTGEIPYYGASGIVDHVSGYLFDEDILLISEDGANLLARTYPIAFSVTGKSWVNNHAHVVRFDRLETQKMVEFYLNSISLDPYVSGMAQPKLSQASLNAIVIPVPPIAEQVRIVGKAETLRAGVERLEEICQEKLDALANLKQSILRKAFAGELTAHPEKALQEAAE